MYPWTNYVAPKATTPHHTATPPIGQQKNVVNLQHTTKKPATTPRSRQHLMSSFVPAADPSLQLQGETTLPANTDPINDAPVSVAPLEEGAQYHQGYDTAQLTQWNQYYYSAYCFLSVHGIQWQISGTTHNLLLLRDRHKTRLWLLHSTRLISRKTIMLTTSIQKSIITN